MPLAFPIYRRYLKDTSRGVKTLSPRLNIALAILFAVVAIMHVIQIPELLRNRKDFWDLMFHIAIATLWLIMSTQYSRRATRSSRPPSSAVNETGD
jgi:hypothetical protein